MYILMYLFNTVFMCVCAYEFFINMYMQVIIYYNNYICVCSKKINIKIQKTMLDICKYICMYLCICLHMQAEENMHICIIERMFIRIKFVFFSPY